MRTLEGLFKSFLILILSYIVVTTLANIFVPQMAPMFNWIYLMMWQVFREFFLEDTVRTIIIAVIVALLFGSMSYKKESAIIGFIGVVVELFILFAGFGGK